VLNSQLLFDCPPLLTCRLLVIVIVIVIALDGCGLFHVVDDDEVTRVRLDRRRMNQFCK
jgi:hypothetical protein